MSATVYIQCGAGSSTTYIERSVPQANYATIDRGGNLVLYCGIDGCGPQAGLFKQWDHVVIDQRWVRDPNGRFVSKENR